MPIPPPLPPALACPYGLTAAAAAAPGPTRSLTSAPGVDPQPSCQRCSVPPPRLLRGALLSPTPFVLRMNQCKRRIYHT